MLKDRLKDRMIERDDGYKNEMIKMFHAKVTYL